MCSLYLLLIYVLLIYIYVPYICVPNGLAGCRAHEAAYDAYMTGVCLAKLRCVTKNKLRAVRVGRCCVSLSVHYICIIHIYYKIYNARTRTHTAPTVTTAQNVTKRTISTSCARSFVWIFGGLTRWWRRAPYFICRASIHFWKRAIWSSSLGILRCR